MKSPEIVTGKNGIAEKMKLLVYNETEDLYFDSLSNEQWMYSSYKSNMLENELLVLQKLPLLSISGVINSLINAGNLDDVATFACILSDRDFDEEHVLRLKLVEILEEYFERSETNFDLEKIALAIYDTELYDRTSRSALIGKKSIEIEDDFRFFADIAQRAKKILDAIENRHDYFQFNKSRHGNKQL